MSRRFAVVLPAYNEAPGLETLLWRITRDLDGHDYEIIVVDDGSTDDTADIADGLSDRMPIHLVRHEVNRGYGAAIRTGLLLAKERADIAVTMDADDSHDPSLIPLMLYGVECGSDVIVASRFVPGGREVGVPIHRMVLSRGAAVVFGRVLKIAKVHDYTSGYRAYRSEFLDKLVSALGEDDFVRETGFTVGVELLLKADRAGASLAEVPLVLRYDRKRSESKLDIRKTMREYMRLLSRVRNEASLEALAEDERRERVARSPFGDWVGATVAVDAATIFISFAIAWLSYRGFLAMGLLDRGNPGVGLYTLIASLYAATTVVTFWRFGLYAPRLSAQYLSHLQRVSEALVVSVALFFTGLFFLTATHPSRLLVILAVGSSFPFMLVSRRVMTGWVQKRRFEEERVGRALIYGAGWTGQLLMKKILEAPRLGTEVVGFLDDAKSVGTWIRHRSSQLSDGEATAKVLGCGRDLAKVAREMRATELYVAIPDIGDARIAALRAETEALGLDLGIVPRMGLLRPDQLQIDDLGSIPVLRLYREGQHPVYDFAKRVLDLSLIVLLLPIAVPLAAVTAAVIYFEGRPVLFRQLRIGLNGRPFTVFKFRTMRADVDPYSASPTTERDPRITKVGRFVRMAGLDELPQLFNVWRGEMSLVGPRPEMPHIVAGYSEIERQRLAVRPGISGLWQLSPNRSQAIHDNLEYDLYYMRQNRLSFDLLIIVETILFMARTLGRSLADLFAHGIVSTSSARLARRREPGRGLQAALGAAERADEFVLVALDQRRRPDEPPSWTRYIPTLGALAEHSPVKLLVADRNEARIRQLAGGWPEGPGVEYVAYGKSTNLRDLAEKASVVVTDLPHLENLAADGDSAVLVIRGNDIDRDSHPERRTVLSERVRLAMIEDGKNALGVAQ